MCARARHIIHYASGRVLGVVLVGVVGVVGFVVRWSGSDSDEKRTLAMHQ